MSVMKEIANWEGSPRAAAFAGCPEVSSPLAESLKQVLASPAGVISSTLQVLLKVPEVSGAACVVHPTLAHVSNPRCGALALCWRSVIFTSYTSANQCGPLPAQAATSPPSSHISTYQAPTSKFSSGKNVVTTVRSANLRPASACKAFLVDAAESYLT